MIETIGKKLCQARLARGLSLDEAAHATRVRQEKLIALENDDYSRFGSNAYAKGFLQIYGRFLGVDVGDHVRALETPRQVTISDYQYLNNAAQPEPTRIQVRRQDQRPSVAPLLVMLALMIGGALVFAGYMFQVTMERLEPKQSTQNAAVLPTPAPTASAQPAAVTDAAGQAASATPAGDQNSNLQPVANTQGAPATDVNALPAEATATSAATEQPTEPSPVVEATSVSNELVVEPLKKTWVKIRRDSPTATPVFEDYLYPGSRPLKLRGSRFYVEVRDQDAVQIRKNGNPIAYQAPGISIQ